MEHSKFKFLGYKVTKINCDISDNFGAKEESLKYKLNIRNNLNKKNKRFVEVILDIRISAKSENINVALDIKGGFIAEEKMPKSIFNLLCNQNAPSILYPYARSIISAITTQANIPPIILPLMNFSKRKISKSKTKLIRNKSL